MTAPVFTFTGDKSEVFKSMFHKIELASVNVVHLPFNYLVTLLR